VRDRGNTITRGVVPGYVGRLRLWELKLEEVKVSPRQSPRLGGREGSEKEARGLWVGGVSVWSWNYRCTIDGKTHKLIRRDVTLMSRIFSPLGLSWETNTVWRKRNWSQLWQTQTMTTLTLVSVLYLFIGLTRSQWRRPEVIVTTGMKEVDLEGRVRGCLL
jgi:hypothetical protein